MDSVYMYFVYLYFVYMYFVYMYFVYMYFVYMYSVYKLSFIIFYLNLIMKHATLRSSALLKTFVLL